MTMSIAVVHNQDANRFEVHADGTVAVLTYQRVGDRIVFTHTGVPPVMEGKGVGKALAQSGLEYAKAEDLAVRPICPFVSAYIARNPEYRDLVR